MTSKPGWVLAAGYLVMATVLLYRAMHCDDGFFCGIVAIPMMIPAGVGYLLLLADHVASPAVLQWPVIVPTLVTNAALFYLAGYWIGRIVGRRG